MKEYLKLLLIIFSTIVYLPSNADDKPVVNVKTAGDYYEVYAIGVGTGITLASAKQAAIENLLPQLIHQTQVLPMNRGVYEEHKDVNSDAIVTTGSGRDILDAHTQICGDWKLENGIYTYKILLKLENYSNKTEKAETPVKQE